MRLSQVFIRLFSTILIFGVTVARQACAQSTIDKIVLRYKAVESQTVNVDQWKNRTNESGTLAWNTSYLLDSYLDMYEITHDRTYLNKFMTLADPLLQITDTRRGVTDYKGRERMGWSSTSYGEGNQRVVYLVQSAMIVYPLARFAEVVNQTSGLTDLANQSKAYQSLAESALREFDADWREDLPESKGHYVFEKGHPLGDPSANETPVPFNMELAAGRVFTVLWKLTRNESYRQKVEFLAQHFKENLQLDPSGAYVWNYSTVSYDRSLKPKPPALEDLSHGAMDVSFAVLAAQHSIVFTRADLEHFAKAYFRYAGTVQKPLDRAELDLWAPLSWESCSVYQAIYPELMTEPVRQVFLNALSELALYTGKCVPK